jgi:hypothetical protein
VLNSLVNTSFHEALNMIFVVIHYLSRGSVFLFCPVIIEITVESDTMLSFILRSCRRSCIGLDSLNYHVSVTYYIFLL